MRSFTERNETEKERFAREPKTENRVHENRVNIIKRKTNRVLNAGTNIQNVHARFRTEFHKTTSRNDANAKTVAQINPELIESGRRQP